MSEELALIADVVRLEVSDIEAQRWPDERRSGPSLSPDKKELIDHF